jgi:hypothetical protein
MEALLERIAVALEKIAADKTHIDQTGNSIAASSKNRKKRHYTERPLTESQHLKRA